MLRNVRRYVLLAVTHTAGKMAVNRKTFTYLTVSVLTVLFLVGFLDLPSPISIELVYDSPPGASSVVQSSNSDCGEDNIPTAVRSAHDGKWHRVPSDRFEIFLYTAFYDARPSIASLPVIRIIAVTEELPTAARLFCAVDYQADQGSGSIGVVVGIRHYEVERLDIGAGAKRHGKIFHEYILNCPLQTEHVPRVVGVVVTENVNVSQAAHATDATDSPLMIPVEHHASQRPRSGIAACVSVAYWMMDPYKLVEWLEIQRIVGVEKVVVYNNSLSRASAKILEYYARTDYLDLRQSHNFISDRGEPTLHLHMSPVINDCMYRYMYRYKNLAIIDFDEVMVPHGRDMTTLFDVLRTVERREEHYHPARSYVFQNAYFFFDHKPDPSQHPHLRTMKYRMRQELSEVGYSAKSIIDPISCHAMHNHYCWGVNRLYADGFHMVFVAPELALLHHYKKCHIDQYENKPGECKRILKEAVHDDVMFKYKDQLEATVNRHLRLLGL